MKLSEGTALQGGKYRIEKSLGQGGFGITYLAEDTRLRRQVVVKEFFIGELCFRENETSQVTVLSEGGRKTVSHARNKFFREAQIVAGLNHPNIITIHDVFEENNTAYYVMEYQPNGSLQDKLKELRGPMAEADALRYIRQVADALDDIHKKQLRHLDVKPGNIMINERGEAVLIDFGLVKVYDDDGNPLSTHSSTLNGYSPRFSPMEQIFADNKTVFTPATDIYALGATLYNLVEGTLPPTINELSGMDGNLPFSETTSMSVRKVVTQAMQLNAVKRPQTIAEFLKLFPQKIEDNPSAIYKKELDEAVALFQKGEYVKALPRFLLLFQTHPDHKPEIGEWMKKCTEKMSDSSSTGEKTMQRKEETISMVDVSEPKAKETFTVNGVSFTMVRVEGGTFRMGATSEQQNPWDDEKPVHSVTLSSYSIGETEVTQALWKAVMGRNPSYFKGDNLPVEQVSWNDCQTFIQELNALTGRTFRLPTEAEWEFAARGGNESRGYQYAGSNNLGNVAWYGDNSGYRTHPVATKSANELGLYDMSGNVWEWCQDGKRSYSSISQTNPIGPSTGSDRVFRGGSWSRNARYCRVAIRNRSGSSFSNYLLGLRLAL